MLNVSDGYCIIPNASSYVGVVDVVIVVENMSRDTEKLLKIMCIDNRRDMVIVRKLWDELSKYLICRIRCNNIHIRILLHLILQIRYGVPFPCGLDVNVNTIGTNILRLL